MIEIMGAPFDLGGAELGTRLGPEALRLAGLAEALVSVGLEVCDSGDVEVGKPSTAVDGLRNFDPMIACVHALQEKVSSALRVSRTPIVLGGEHTVVPGGISAALAHFSGDLSVLWIDAHADMNTAGTSETGNLHGMPLAALVGSPSGASGARDREWQAWLKTLGQPKLNSARIAWLGLRDVDETEKAAIASAPESFVASMHDVDRHGIVSELERFDAWMKRSAVSNLWISFDVDALDPFLAPGTGTAVRGGLSYREAHLCAEILHEQLSHGPYRLAGLDLVEANPVVDTNNETARMTVEWAASLFGKTILGRRGSR